MARITEVPASEKGALPGFAWTCSICGDTQSSSQRSLAESDAEAHAKWHAFRDEVYEDEGPTGIDAFYSARMR